MHALTNITVRPEKLSGLSLLTPADLRQANEGDEVNIDTNILNLYPDPMHFVRFLKEIDRPDISSDIFVKLLEAYRAHKAREEVDPTRLVHRVLEILLTQWR